MQDRDFTIITGSRLINVYGASWVSVIRMHERNACNPGLIVCVDGFNAVW